MRRTWNSWTYYGSDQQAKPDATDSSPRQSLKRDGVRSRRSRESKPALGPLDDAQQQTAADMMAYAMDLSDVRNERVARVRRSIEDGSYRVPSKDLAEKLIKNMLGDYR